MAVAREKSIGSLILGCPGSELSMERSTDYFPKFLFGAYLALFIVLAISPYDRSVWFAENLPIFGIALLQALGYMRGVRFSNLAYVLMSVLLFMHTIGGHYTFERVPFDWFNNFFGFERNMYDRVAHFSVGFYAFALAEWLDRIQASGRRFVVYLFPLFAIAFIAMGYEIVEWWFAISSDPSAGGAFLGSQGDIWDAQKDMLADTLGAVAALMLYALKRERKSHLV